MTLPAAGPISTADIAAELGVAGPIDITSAAARDLAGVAAGPVTLPNSFWGKANFNVGFSIGGQADLQAGSAASGVRRVRRILTASVQGSGSYTYAWTQGGSIYSGFSGATNGATADWSQPYNVNEGAGSPVPDTTSITLTVTDTVKGLTLTATHLVTLG